MSVIKLENISKKYQIGTFGAATFKQDVLQKLGFGKKKENKIEENDRTKLGNSNIVWALKDINFEVEKGEILGIIGRNGAGKSTLLKVLSQVTAPSTGTIKIKGRMASLLEVGTGFHPELSGRENIFLNGAILGMTKKEIKSKFDEIVNFAGVQKYIDTPVKRYSSGMYVRLAFAVAAHLEPEILVVDEVLAVGDQEFQNKCIGKMQDVSSKGRTVLFVSHNMGSVRSLCNRGIVMEKGKIVYGGDIEDCINYYLNTGVKANENGNIEINDQGIGTGEASFTAIKLLNKKNELQRTVPYKSPIILELKINAEQDFDKSIIDIKILTKQGQTVSYSCNKFNHKTIDISKGNNTLKIELENPLFPGQYSFTIGIANGRNMHTIEMLENVLDFEVLKTGESMENNYPYNFVHAPINIPGKWLKD